MKTKYWQEDSEATNARWGLHSIKTLRNAYCFLTKRLRVLETKLSSLTNPTFTFSKTICSVVPGCNSYSKLRVVAEDRGGENNERKNEVL